MSKEILYVVDAVSNEKNLEAEDIFEAVEIAIATATRKKYGAEQDFRVDIDRETGDYDTFRRWQVMDDEDPEFESPERHILKSYADDRKLGLEIGEFLEEGVESIEFGRITAQIAKQVIMQKVRHAERQKVADAFQESVGKLVLGTVKRVDRRGIVLDLDIIPWDDDIARFVINAMQPAEVLSIVIDEDKKSMDIGVDEEMLAQAIGKGGQNVRLASKLTGWTLNVMSEEEAESKSKSEQSIMVSLFAEKLDVDEEVASILVDEGFSSLDEVAYVPMEEFLKIEEFDEEIIEELRSRARNALLALAITGEGGKPAQDLLEMKGMNNALAQLLASKGI
ncbi:UNVERIFIED_CONTAM: hypothetical protein GTU68_032063, partial [Idotea baltica]|nr:hypothetical protein [Idotea baltica]